MRFVTIPSLTRLIKMNRTHLSSLDDRALLRLRGKDAKGFLQNLVTNDLESLSETQTVYAALLTPQGKFLHDFILLEWQGSIFIDCLGERTPDLIRRLTLYKLRAEVTIEDVTEDYKIFAAFGDGEFSLNNSALETGNAEVFSDHIMYSDPRLSSLGYRVIAQKNSPWQNQHSPMLDADISAYVRHRLSLGVPEGGLDIAPEKNFLLEVNFEELNGVSFSKGCYVGQELTARTKHRAKIKKRLLQFSFDGPLSIGDPITLNGKEVTNVVSFEKPFGLAFIRLSDWIEIGKSESALTPVGLKINKPDYVILPDQEN